MKKFLKDFFHLSNSELKGALMLLFFIVFVFLFPKIYWKYKDVKTTNDKSFENWVVELNRIEDSTKLFTEKQKKIEIESQKLIKQKLFSFDPNVVTYKEMKALGFDGKTANILLNYRKNGAKFYDKKDLMKIYGFTENLYEKLAPFVKFPTKEKNFKPNKPKQEKAVIKLFEFDPNTVTYKEMLQLGIDGKTANILLKFRAKGAKFSTKKDLLKVYGFSEDLYGTLEDFIQLPITDSIEMPKPKANAYDSLIVDINSADVLIFKKLKGIGPYFAKEIIEYREKLGGFYSKKQLKEVYGITDELFAQIENKLVLKKQVYRKINLNNTTFKELIRHPYISKEMTIAILKLKKELASFTKVADLIYYDTIDENEFEKVENYLIVL